MPGCTVIGALDQYADLSSVPAHRQLRGNNLVEHLRKAVPFAHVAVGGLDLEGYNFGYGYSIDTDMPPSYIDSYFAETMSMKDPIVTAGKTSATPLTEEEAYDLWSPPQRLLYMTQAHDIRNRILIPLSRNDAVYGAVCFTNGRPFTKDEFDFLITMAEPLHRAITKPLMDRFAASTLRLTAGELSCLRQASHGMTSEEIAKEIPYTTDTISSYLKTAAKKLGTSNRVQVVAEAIRRHLID
ncbi:LuxR family transcriptional regulator [Agrobacterium sp. SHOUNA12C]|jgi:DNA-binding CsgD family transcriptional regulator|uniref:Autoinducer binding domain protein n=1 Tax=Rhizobium rhizogenes TaxID=359 RepID=A0A7S4ZTT8_RHIRH|nr:LuxR family transcriptional regulator [Rhizobium rhizogenes]MCJ9723886.1 LuxR family transcriptional regulator [Agrobacterium sp. BETTINA12B]MCJ9759478.1 LuxR family transcriptional regulator [Agrobacterium sp. SHOUNA12C]NTG30025.1 LuxR family transcriptional regulator [Rhizobium rhizogenes]NTH66660.1 LuxR family transcriptional regulator [Rhizobium rhizogenes]QCL09241.1 autoinducer binding domain protein [Rhizobium rhizogenes]